MALTVERLPGVEAPFTVGDLAENVTVVVGPNASGKSSMIRALRALWHPNLYAHQQVDVKAEFLEASSEGAGVTWRAERRGPTITWERGGVPVEAPPTPPEHLLNSYLVALETLMQSGPTDAAISAGLRREMTGGYDLTAARQAVALKLSGQRRAAAEFGKARRSLEGLERAHRGLHERQQRRSELEAERAAAAELAAGLPKYERAVQLRSQLADLTEAQARLAGMPGALADLTGREGEELARLRDDHAAADERREQAHRRAAAARAALADTGLAGTELDQASAQALLAAADDLSELVNKAGENRRRHAEIAAQVREPWQRLGGLRKGPTRAAFREDTLDEAERALGERLTAGVQLAAAQAEAERLEAELVELTAQGEDAHPALSDADLADARTNLSNWLAAPLPAPRPGLFSGPTLLLGLAAALLLVATVVLLANGASGSLLARAAAMGAGLYIPAGLGAAAWIAGVVWLLVRGATGRSRGTPGGAVRSHGPQAEAAMTAYLRTGAEPPTEWEHGAVSRRLQQLLSLAAQRRAQEARGLDVRARLSVAERRAAMAEEGRRAADARLAELARTAGYGSLGAGELGAGFAAWLRDVRLVNDLQGMLRGLREARAELERQADALHQRLSLGLRGTPFALNEQGSGPAVWRDGKWHGSKLDAAEELRTRVRRAAWAVTQRDQAATDARRAEADLVEAEAAMSAAEERRAALVARCGLEPSASGAEAQLHALLAARPEYLETKEQEAELITLVRDGEAQLAATPHVLAAVRWGDAQALEEGRTTAQQASEQHDELNRRIGALEAEVRKAEEGRALEDARLHVERTGREVTAHLKRAHLNVAADVLLEEIEQEHRVKRQPAVLERAQEWFARFTNGAFELEFETGGADEERLRARDVASGRLLLPAELSTGTRAQLLLALRVSHAAHAEAGRAKLPFFLDEALTTADATRFAEVAASLLEFSQADRRQIIYLSARQEDAAAWRRVAEQGGGGHLVSVIDLAEVRGQRR